MTIYFTSDSHWNHNNILKFEDRPFDTLESMSEGLIKIWNETIKPDDQVFHLGDFCFGGYDKWVEIIEQLNGQITIIKGNHDKVSVIEKLHENGYLKDAHMVGHYMKVNKHVLHLTHYPLDIGNRVRNWSISGHIHSTPSRMLNQVNIGVDSPLNFDRPFGQPISIDELITYLDYMTPQIEAEFKRERGIID